MGNPSLMSSLFVLCGFVLSPGCSTSPTFPRCGSAMAVSVETPSNAVAFETTEAAIDLGGSVRLPDSRLFQTRVTVVNRTRGTTGSCDVRTTDEPCRLTWITLAPVDLDLGNNEIVVGADAPEDSASTTVLVTRIASEPGP